MHLRFDEPTANVGIEMRVGVGKLEVNVEEGKGLVISPTVSFLTAGRGQQKS